MKPTVTWNAKKPRSQATKSTAPMIANISRLQVQL
jgi:hypothetical protein